VLEGGALELPIGSLSGGGPARHADQAQARVPVHRGAAQATTRRRACMVPVRATGSHITITVRARVRATVLA
jgi:hypothetical protein